MKDSEMKDLISDGAKRLGIQLDDARAQTLTEYARLLQKWNEKMNLTAITDDRDIVTKHFLDSLTPLCTGYVKGKVIDVGTGAGFPGLVLKIAKPEIEISLLDSLQKRIDFLGEVCSTIDIDEVDLLHDRAEFFGRLSDYRNKFDTVVSRAVANLALLCEWCMPFLKLGGHFLALKGPSADEEIKEARRAINVLGGKLVDVYDADIPFTDLTHKIVVIKKVGQTPFKYPRKTAIATKNPIRTCYKSSK